MRSSRPQLSPATFLVSAATTIGEETHAHSLSPSLFSVSRCTPELLSLKLPWTVLGPLNSGCFTPLPAVGEAGSGC